MPGVGPRNLNRASLHYTRSHGLTRICGSGCTLTMPARHDEVQRTNLAFFVALDPDCHGARVKVRQRRFAVAHRKTAVKKELSILTIAANRDRDYLRTSPS